MILHEIAIPAEPISAATRHELEIRLAAAHKQWKFATEAWRVAEQAMITERRVYDMIECLLQAGPDHVFSTAIVTERSSIYPYCRHCRARGGSITARGSCEGDTHQCPSSVRPGESDAAIRMHKRGDLMCGQRGKMSADFTSWFCILGHVTDRSHAESRVRHDLARCLPSTCPWPDLIDSFRKELLIKLFPCLTGTRPYGRPPLLAGPTWRSQVEPIINKGAALN
jgi:hypothetical protein